jgi:8-oxo-dGTP pyrophosphatase MutT (NUDIX family)
MTNTLNDETISTPPRDAATVILIKDGAAGLEVLLLCRGNSRTVMNQAWVFPGGKVDDADFEHEAEVLSQLSAQPQNLLAEDIPVKKACALFQAAVRETSEETSVVLTAGAVHPWSRWITPNEPSMMKKRFDARFFVAALPTDKPPYTTAVRQPTATGSLPGKPCRITWTTKSPWLRHK